jgi:uncharacterized protein YkwD
VKPHRHLRRAMATLGAACWLGGSLQAQAASDPLPPELMAALSASRSHGCAGRPGVRAPLRAVQQLNQAAQRMASGEPADRATRQSGYRSTRLFAANMSGYATPAAVGEMMAEKYCSALTDPKLTDIGFHQRGTSYWIVLAAPFAPPLPSDTAAVGQAVLKLTNDARSHPRKCGATPFAAAPPIKPNPMLDQAAAVHARDMARHGALRHEGSDGSAPADRVSRAGYRWRSVGENIAGGQPTPEQVVQDWVGSPPHCANLMNPGFTEMGVGYAVNKDSADGIYWAQVFGRPGGGPH